jgi:hypothetical protein
VDLEQREGRVHRFKGHAVRRNLASGVDDSLPIDTEGDIWQGIFDWAKRRRSPQENDLVPFWIYPTGPARIERHVPLPPFSRDTALLPVLHRSLAAYRLAFGQPRQDDFIEFLSEHYSDDDLLKILQDARIDLSPSSRLQMKSV